MIYKVVRETQQNGIYHSAVMNPQEDGEWCLEYKIGEVTNPIRGSYIYAFKQLERAEYFISHNHGDPVSDPPLVIFECEAEVTEDALPLLAYSFSPVSYERFWKREGTDGAYAPLGSVWCKWVKLVKPVEDQ